MKASSRSPITIRVHQELNVPWKLISVWMSPSTQHAEHRAR